jgi:hypothetical protein
MTIFARRIILASAISALGFALTFGWYSITDPAQNASRDSKPVARLISHLNEVQRKTVTQLIWQPITENDILYAGEAVRTGVNAEAAIEFLDSATRIDLDPDSAIVLEETTSGELALNFISGNLVVKSDGDSGAQLKLKSGDQSISLSKSEVALGKSGSNALDMQVLKGQAQVERNGQLVTLDKSKTLSGEKSLEILSPKPEDLLFVDVAAGEPVIFRWSPTDAQTDAQDTVSLESGSRRQDLVPVPGASTAGNTGTLKALLKPGRVYYRLVARSPSGATRYSPVFKNTIFAKVPPRLLEPSEGSEVTVQPETPSVGFAWVNSIKFEKTFFEIGSDPKLTNIVFKKELGSQHNYSLDIKTPGRLYWRVSGLLKNGEQPLQSPIQTFVIKVVDRLAPPIPLLPLAGDKQIWEKSKDDGVTFEWTAVPKVSGYVLRVKPGTTEIKTRLTKVKVKGLNPGSFEWTVTAVLRDDPTKPGASESSDGAPGPDGPKEKESKPSELRKFTLTQLPILQWAGPSPTAKEFYYVSLKPTLDLFWQKGAAPIDRYRVTVRRKDSDDILTRTIPATSAIVPLPADDTYLVYVEGLNSRLEVLARTEPREIKVMAAPLLPAPQFLATAADASGGTASGGTASGGTASGGSAIDASPAGSAALAWSLVNGANGYILSIEAPDKSKNRELRFEKAQAALRGLLPGEYKMTLKSVDQHGRHGPAGEPRILRVPATSQMPAPRLKGLKVK